MTETVEPTSNTLVTITVDSNNLVKINGEIHIKASLRRADGRVAVGDTVAVDDVATDTPFEARVASIEDNEDGKPGIAYLRTNWATVQKETLEDEVSYGEDDEKFYDHITKTMVDLYDRGIIKADIGAWVILQANAARQSLLDARNENSIENPVPFEEA